MDYKITWKGTDGDYYPLRKDSNGKTYKPECNVIHIMQGTLAGTDQEFNNPRVQASTHYGIGKNGEIHQYVRTEDAAWGNGFLTNPNWIFAKKYPGVNPNLYTISYELEGMSGDVPTEAQMNALLYLLKLNNAKYDISNDKNTHIGHFVIDPVNRPFCPGKGFDWTKLYNMLGIIDKPITMPILKRGIAGESVKFLQVQLQKKGYTIDSDSIFGANTFNIVMKFQKANGLIADGIVGPATWGKLM